MQVDGLVVVGSEIPHTVCVVLVVTGVVGAGEVTRAVQGASAGLF